MHDSNLWQTNEVGDIEVHHAEGEAVSMSIKNVFGGNDYFHDGQLAVRTAPNIQGGQDLVEDGRTVLHSEPNVHGGDDYYHQGQHVGSAIPNAHGGLDMYSNGDLTASSMPLNDGFSIVMEHSDPLLHIDDYHIGELHLPALGLIDTRS